MVIILGGKPLGGEPFRRRTFQEQPEEDHEEFYEML